MLLGSDATCFCFLLGVLPHKHTHTLMCVCVCVCVCNEYRCIAKTNAKGRFLLLHDEISNPNALLDKVYAYLKW